MVVISRFTPNLELFIVILVEQQEEDDRIGTGDPEEASMKEAPTSD